MTRNRGRDVPYTIRCGRCGDVLVAREDGLKCLHRETGSVWCQDEKAPETLVRRVPAPGGYEREA